MTEVLTATQIIDRLEMQPHPEGGHYVETWRGPDGGDGRAIATAIYFLLGVGERSQWHRVDAAEIWLFHSGAPIRLTISRDVGEASTEHWLGADLAAGEHPQVIVPASSWQSAESTGDWTLVSCVVAPGFEFDGFDLAPPDWEPSGNSRTSTNFLT